MGGQLITAQDAEFTKIAFGGPWNQLAPARAPQLIVCDFN
jgi:hypothetical protein